MALVDNVWYVNDGDNSTTGWWAVTAWSNNSGAGTVYSAGNIRRQSGTPTVGNERVYVCIVAGTGGTGADPLTTFTRGVKITDAAVTWQECTGIAALNGDATNTPSWTITATPPGGVKGTVVTLGQVIKRDNGASFQIASTGGTAGSGAEPAFSDTAGTTTNDNTVVWTSLGVVGNFTGWQAPHARLASAFTSTWGRVGNTFFVASEHAETQSTACAPTSPGTDASPCFVYCVTKTTVPPVSANLTTGATITTTGASTIILGGTTYVRGIAFSCGTGATSSAFSTIGSYVFDSCAIAKLGTTGVASAITLGNAANITTVLNNTTVQFGATVDAIASRETVIWRNTASAIVGGTLPTNLLQPGQGQLPGNIFVEGVDLSALTAGKNLVGISGISNIVVFKDCKLGAGVTVATTPTSRGGPQTDLIRGDSSGTNYRHERYRYEGTQIVETTIIRTSGASDGTTSISWKIVSTANSKWVNPFESMAITQWVDSTGSHAVTVYGTTTGGGVPNDDDIWIDVVYLSSNLTPIGSFQTTTKTDNLAASAATNNSSDASIWAGGGAGNGFKIVTPSFTVGQKGYVTVYVKVAKATSTYYIDPLVTVT